MKTKQETTIELESGDVAIVWRAKESRGFEFIIPEMEDDVEIPPDILFFAAMSQLPEKHPELYEKVIDTFLAGVEAEQGDND